MITKKTVLWISLIGTLFLTLDFYLEKIEYYYSHHWTNSILWLLNMIGFNIFLFPVILFFSLLTYKMRNEIFEYWVKFSRWYIPIYIIFTYIVTNLFSDGQGFASVVRGWFGLVILSFFLIIFSLISLILIISKHLSIKKKIYS